MTEAEYQALLAKKNPPKPKQAKYRNKKTEVDNRIFDSKKEANRYLELRMAEKAGKIRDLRTQYVYTFVIDGIYVGKYTADFVYNEHDGSEWRRVVEDAKSSPTRTEAYQLRKKLMLAIHGVTIRET